MLDAAIAVIADGGLAAATTRAITERAGVSPSALHYYFPTHDALIQALGERELQRSLAEAWEAVSSTCGMRRGVELALTAYVDRVRADEHYYIAVAELTLGELRHGGSPSVTSGHARALAESVALIQQWVDQRGARLRVPVEALASTLLSCASSVAMVWLKTHDEAAVRQQIRTLALALSELEDTPADSPPPVG